MPTISAVKTNDREFDDSNVCGSMKDNVAELDTQVVIADGLFFGDIFWMTSALQLLFGSAVLALQEAAEAYLVGLFEDTNLCAIHA